MSGDPKEPAAAGLAVQGGRALWRGPDGRALDVERASGGRFGPDPMTVLARWDAFLEWATGQEPAAGEAVAAEALGPCVPRPGSVFGIGLNYRDHAAEAGLEVPKQPMVFTKFPSCLAGPCAAVRLPSDRVDFEAELVVVIGREAEAVAERDALGVVAGYCAGQDVSDRKLQFADRPPQFSMGKSRPTFGPLGPAVVPLAAFGDPLDLAITCDVSGERLQDSRTREMIFAVPELVAWLSRHCRLAPGDLIFTGTPAGVGSTRDPRRYLAPGDEIATRIEGVGALRNACVAAEEGAA